MIDSLLTLALALPQAGPVALPQYGARRSRAPWPAREYFVDAAVGSDTNPGTAASPWRTVQYAADHATAGSRVRIAAGVYAERVVMRVEGDTLAGPIAFVGDDGAVIDGSGFTDADLATWSGAFGLGLVDITDRSYIRLENLEIRGLSTADPDLFVQGLHVANTADGAPMESVSLVRLDVHDIRYTGTDDWGGAHGVGVYGGDLASPLTDVVLAGCRIHDLRLGQSESITFNGNVDGFRIRGSEVHDNDNIGISVIGWEGTAGGSLSDDSSDANAHLYGGHDPRDQARNGVVAGNVVRRCSTNAPVQNPTYPPGDWSAGGIYVDGARDLVVERNLVVECDLGITVGCEHGGVDTNGAPRASSGVIVRSNEVLYCGQAGIQFGGYNSFRGVTHSSWFVNNTVYKCSSLGWAGGQVHVAKSFGNVIANNVLVARGAADVADYDGFNNGANDRAYDAGVVLGSSVSAPDNQGNALAHNLYWCADGTAALHWKWEHGDDVDPIQGTLGIAALDAAALFGAPGFVQGSLGLFSGTEDLRIGAAASPAVDSGDGSLDMLGRLDRARTPRRQGGGVDRGAHER